MNETTYRTAAELLAGLDEIRRAPADQGVVEAIVIRPASDQRQALERCRLTQAGGIEGDRWSRECWLKDEHGNPHPEVQVCIMSARAIQLIAGSRERWALAGDNLFVDLDLSRDNLVAGQRLAIGETVIEITAQDHNGCSKFSARYGPEAVRFVNSEDGRHLRLRGIYAKVVQEGEIQVGQAIRKV